MASDAENDNLVDPCEFIDELTPLESEEGTEGVATPWIEDASAFLAAEDECSRDDAEVGVLGDPGQWIASDVYAASTCANDSSPALGSGEAWMIGGPPPPLDEDDGFEVSPMDLGEGLGEFESDPSNLAAEELGPDEELDGDLPSGFPAGD